MGSGKVRRPSRLRLPRARLAIEADGWEFHSGKAAWQHDLRRRNALTALGWRVLNVTWQALSERPEEVLEQVRQVLGGFFCPEARTDAHFRAKVPMTVAATDEA